MSFMVGIAANAYDLGSGSDALDQKEHLEVCIDAHQRGFQSIFVFEHHFTSYIVSPTPMTALAYLAGRASNAWLGSSVLILPSYQLARLAEMIAYVDNLTGGKCLFGLGRGRGDEELRKLGAERPSYEDFARQITSLKAYLGPDSHIRPKPAFQPAQRFCLAVGADLHPSLARLGLIGMRNWSPTIPAGSGGIIFVPATVSSTSGTALRQAQEALSNDIRLMDAHYGARTGMSFDKRLAESVDSSLVGTPKQVLRAIREVAHHSRARHVVLELAIGGRPLAEVREMASSLASAAAADGGWAA